MAQKPFIESPQQQTTSGQSVRQAFEDYIQSKKRQKEAEGQKWGAESKYRTSLKLIEDAGIVIDNMTLEQFNSEENIERVMTNERLLKGEKTLKGDRTFGTGTVRNLGNHLNTLFNNLRSGEANALASWNAKNKGRVNPFDDGADKIPFSTLGFDLTVRKIPGQIKTAPDAVMLKAFRDTLNDIQDVQVGKTTIPAKIVKAHMLMSVVTGMRSPDINNFVSQINPTQEQLEATDSVKTFLRSDDYSMVINNKGKLTEYALNPTLYSILSDATQSASGEKVFPSSGSIEKSYLDILQDKLTQAGYPSVKQSVKGVFKDVPLSHNILRKFAFSFVERIPEAEGGGTSNADALIQHKGERTIGETTYRAGTLGEFQTTKETTAQSAFLRRLLSDITPVEFLTQQGFNTANFVSELYDVTNESDMKSLGDKAKLTVADRAAYEVRLDELDMDAETKAKVQSSFPTQQSFNMFMQGYSPDGDFDADDVKEALSAQEAQRVQASQVATQPKIEAPVEPERDLASLKEGLTDTSSEPTLSRQEGRDKMGDFLRGLSEAAKKTGPKLVAGAATGLGLAATVAEEALAATPAAFAEAGERPAPSTVRQADYLESMPVPRTSEADTPQRLMGDEDRFIAQATDEGGMQYLDNLEETYQKRVEAEQPAISTGIMRDSGITELDPRSINQEQLDKIRTARRDLQSQAAELFNR